MEQMIAGLMPAAKMLGLALIGTAILVTPIMLFRGIGFLISLAIVFLFLAYGIGGGDIAVKL
jgi:hypothetical protein